MVLGVWNGLLTLFPLSLNIIQFSFHPLILYFQKQYPLLTFLIVISLILILIFCLFYTLFFFKSGSSVICSKGTYVSLENYNTGKIKSEYLLQNRTIFFFLFMFITNKDTENIADIFGSLDIIRIYVHKLLTARYCFSAVSDFRKSEWRICSQKICLFFGSQKICPFFGSQKIRPFFGSQKICPFFWLPENLSFFWLPENMSFFYLPEKMSFFWLPENMSARLCFGYKLPNSLQQDRLDRPLLGPAVRRGGEQCPLGREGEHRGTPQRHGAGQAV